ncbi:MAG: glucosidase [Deltaproteobacteria bacterium]|nr:glucosidase [Deltaproteobacteria bacterium]
MTNEIVGARIRKTAEGQRLFSESSVKMNPWRKWGPYTSERQWGTVREDYSADGAAWEFFPHDHARSRAYRWGEDGIGGICDNHQILCFALALWNGNDAILKERLFGLTGNEGNHGEDVKEIYHYVDSTPTHSYMKYLYRYTQRAFPYSQLKYDWRNVQKDRNAYEYELIDTGAFDGDAYFDVEVEYAKASWEDMVIRISAFNRGASKASLTLLPTLWFRNLWSWGIDGKSEPSIEKVDDTCIKAHSDERQFGDMYLCVDGAKEVLFCNNETNLERFNWGSNGGRPKKDGINDYIVSRGAIQNIDHQRGTKAAFYCEFEVDANSSATVTLRFSKSKPANPFGDAAEILTSRQKDADSFYEQIFLDKNLNADETRIARQAFAGMLWSKQFYHYIVEDWLNGDPGTPRPPESRKGGRNAGWKTTHNEDIISMPDKWEYPWYATWDLAFHTITFAHIDPDFAKHQLRLFTCEWYLHPNGQLPAYEWNFNDVNPPVHAFATWRVFEMERDLYGVADHTFLTRVYSKLLLYFTWWTNRKDAEGNNLFEGGFLGLDNISALDRSNLNLKGNVCLEQSDGTAWMGIFCLNMLKISIELGKANAIPGSTRGNTYADMAYKFFQHFLLIANAFNELQLWDEADGFYYDSLRVPKSTVAGDTSWLPDPVSFRMKLRSMVGLLPIAATEKIPKSDLQMGSTDFKDRVDWFVRNRPDLTKNRNIHLDTQNGDLYLSLVSPERLKRILDRMVDPEEFLSDFGLRSLSRIHAPDKFPYRMERALLTNTGNTILPEVKYCPAESDTGMFGGNSNWRGPIWMPVNYLMVDALKKHGAHYSSSFTVAFPKGSDNAHSLQMIASQISRRLVSIFAVKDGKRPVYGGTDRYQSDPHWKDYILFYEYFHGDNGAGVGASHQTGWTGLIANLLLEK